MEVALHARPRVILGCCGVLSNKSDWHLGEVESSHGLQECWGADPLEAWPFPAVSEAL